MWHGVWAPDENPPRMAGAGRRSKSVPQGACPPAPRLVPTGLGRAPLALAGLYCRRAGVLGGSDGLSACCGWCSAGDARPVAHGCRSASPRTQERSRLPARAGLTAGLLFNRLHIDDGSGGVASDCRTGRRRHELAAQVELRGGGAGEKRVAGCGRGVMPRAAPAAAARTPGSSPRWQGRARHALHAPTAASGVRA